MIKIILPIVSFLICSIVFAQETKPCLFIGTYEKNKRGICSDYELVHEEIKDYADYDLKRIQFQEAHKLQSPSTLFIDKNESVIAYQYEQKMAGRNCNSSVISIKTSKSIEDCFKQFADQQAKDPKDFATQPKNIFTWQGKGNKVVEYFEDFGGLNGKFSSGNTATKTIIVAQLSNDTKNKLACVSLKMDNGKETVEYIYPGNRFSKKYDTKKLEIKVIYQDNGVEPTDEAINAVKNFVHKCIINENGKLKTVPSSTVTGVRG